MWNVWDDELSLVKNLEGSGLGKGNEVNAKIPPAIPRSDFIIEILTQPDNQRFNISHTLHFHNLL